MSHENIQLANLNELKPLSFTVNAQGDIVLPAALREKLLQEINDGYIVPAESEDGSLVMLKYAKSAMYDGHWNPTTLNFRGVLTDANFKKVYARGFTKFFNVSEHDKYDTLPELPMDSPVVLANKMDGSLGLITMINDEIRVFTSGSAQRNEIAAEAEKILRELMIEHDVTAWKPPENVTILVEIISEVNKIVVDYGNARRLVALSAVDNLTGTAVSDDELRRIWFGEVVEKTNDGKPMTYAESVAMEVPQGEEGFVLEFQGEHANVRAKVKGEEYVIAHRIITNISVRQLWLAISQNTSQTMLNDAERTSPERAFPILKAAHDVLVARRDAILEERLKHVAEYIAKFNAEHDFSIRTTEDLEKKDMSVFMLGLKNVAPKNMFPVDVQIAKGDLAAARDAALKMIRPRGNSESIISLVSAEKSEVGDDMDDQ